MYHFLRSTELISKSEQTRLQLSHGSLNKIIVFHT